MMRAIVVSKGIGALVCVLAAAQTMPAQGGPIFHADSRLVVCYTTVRDRQQHPVHDLPQSAFAVYEDGRPQAIRTFGNEDIPVSLGLVIDNSAAMAGKRTAAVAASLALVRASNPDDEVFVANFNDEVYLDLPSRKDFTNDIQEMEKALDRLESRGAPLVWDAVRLSMQHLVEKSRREKKVLVIVTTGLDAGSLTTAEALTRLAGQSGVLIYTIGLLDVVTCGAAEARRKLKALAEATGGEAFFPASLSATEAVCRQIARDIREQYVLAYAPSNQQLNDAFRRISIKLTGPGQLAARTRSGYYASTK
jgi:Ca-activated chloride channel homolog